MTDWIYDTTIDTSQFYGFVYLITNLETGRMYVGRKYLTMSGGKKKVRKESNWKKYWGSCKLLLEEIKLLGEDKFKREILSFQKTRGECNYAEVEEQIKRDVLKSLLSDGSRAYYNGNIMSRWFAAREYPEGYVSPLKGRKRPQEVCDKISITSKGREVSDFAKARASEVHKGKKLSAEHCELISRTHKGVPKTQQHRDKIGKAHKGMIRTEETRKRISDARKLEIATVGSRPQSSESRAKIGDGNRKITPEYEQIIRDGYANGLIPKVIGASIGVSDQTIRRWAVKLNIKKKEKK